MLAGTGAATTCGPASGSTAAPSASPSSRSPSRATRSGWPSASSRSSRALTVRTLDRRVRQRPARRRRLRRRGDSPASGARAPARGRRADGGRHRRDPARPGAADSIRPPDHRRRDDPRRRARHGLRRRRWSRWSRPGEVDLHLAVPSRALAVAKALGALPGRVFIVGCEPAEVDELTTVLTPPVGAAVDTALAHVRPAARRRPRSRSARRSQAARRDPADHVLACTVKVSVPMSAAADILRFIGDEHAVRAALGQLVEDGYLRDLADDPSGAQPISPDRAGHSRRPPPVPRRVRAVPGAARPRRVRLGRLRLPSRRRSAGSLA